MAELRQMSGRLTSTYAVHERVPLRLARQDGSHGRGDRSWLGPARTHWMRSSTVPRRSRTGGPDGPRWPSR